MHRLFRFESFRKIYILLILLAIISSITILFCSIPFTQPYTLELIQQRFTAGKESRIFHDFDQDGFSEGVIVSSDSTREKYELVFQAYQHDLSIEGIIDQFDFSGEILPKRIFYHDFSGDGFDEAVVFCQKNDSLYLSIINISQKSYFLKKYPFLSVEKPNPFHKWDIRYMKCLFYDTDNDGNTEIIFALRSGKSLHPRGVYIFDPIRMQFKRSFITNAGISGLALFDITDDGIEEIILTGRATGNIAGGEYSDHTNWLFVMDMNLKPVFPIKHFSEYPGSIVVNPLYIDGLPHFLISVLYAGTKLKPVELYLMNREGIVIKTRKINEQHLSGVYIMEHLSEPKIYFIFNYGKISVLDFSLEKINEKILNLHLTGLRGIIDLNHDGHEELILSSASGMHVFDENLNLLATHQTDKKYKGIFSIRENGLDKNRDIAFSDYSNDNILSFYRNPFYTALPLFFLISTLLFFALFVFIFWSGRRLFIYVHYFLISLNHSTNGILFLNHKGKSIFINRNVQKFLNLSTQLQTGEHYTNSFKDNTNIIGIISKSIAEGRQQSLPISITKSEHQFKGDLVVIPFRPKIGPAFAYLIEIKDFTNPINSDRLQSWARTIQKMAHDIKQPLQAISNNLAALGYRLESLNLDENEDINDDMNTMQEELSRIRVMTNNFLKFVNLDQPNIQYIQINTIITESVKRYADYQNHELKLVLELGKQLPRTLIDAQQFELVLHTLIENALDALKGEGMIRISTMMAQYLNKSFSDYIQIEIHDTGPGMNTEVLDKIFEPFFTTKKHGTGIGLALAKKIIEDHQGFIEVDSRIGLGTTFICSIPVFEE